MYNSNIGIRAFFAKICLALVRKKREGTIGNRKKKLLPEYRTFVVMESFIFTTNSFWKSEPILFSMR